MIPISKGNQLSHSLILPMIQISKGNQLPRSILIHGSNFKRRNQLPHSLILSIIQIQKETNSLTLYKPYPTSTWKFKLHSLFLSHPLIKSLPHPNHTLTSTPSFSLSSSNSTLGSKHRRSRLAFGHNKLQLQVPNRRRIGRLNWHQQVRDNLDLGLRSSNGWYVLVGT